MFCKVSKLCTDWQPLSLAAVRMHSQRLFNLLLLSLNEYFNI